ncbi:hypothetical protein [Plantactinospora endophytica]|uniref:Uncharacterized protein n=1 Tax=Plantactinospora endophytica TaxID=673535 RepID=A0ABQ4ECZ9_9ACTN|nr:hypothetical protein [Plantactinospora endophytica]GIG92564.1 hypothetical protein Pen02_75000 [Plantactinospora endophytica]
MRIGIDIGGVIVQQVDRLYPDDQPTGPEPAPDPATDSAPETGTATAAGTAPQTKTETAAGTGTAPETGTEGEDTALLADFRRTPPMPGVFEALAALVSEMFGEHVYLVSKCGERVERRTGLWLHHHDFYRRTGIRVENVHFCRTRQGKAPIAAALGLTHFVDDRLEVLSYLETVPHRYLFRPREHEVRSFRAHLPAVHRVESWPELMARIGDSDQTGVRIS